MRVCGRLVLCVGLLGLCSCSDSSEGDDPEPSFVDVEDVEEDRRDRTDVTVPPETYDLMDRDHVPDWKTRGHDDADIGSPCGPGGACPGDPCDDNSDCLSGWCVEHLGEDVCTLPCIEECPEGWSCQQVAGVDRDLVFICVSDFPTLCRPCKDQDSCEDSAGSVVACVHYGPQGKFCGGSCEADDDCVEGYSCVESVSVEGVTSLQCVHGSGECPCTEASTEASLWTTCTTSNELGVCEGKRICEEDGLSDCDAAEATDEVCDGVDNDCDGETDVGSCDDGDPCTVGDACVDAACQGTEPLDCTDGNPCTADSCAPGEGCVYENVDGPCVDDNPCAGIGACVDGLCVPGPAVDCDDQNPCTDDVCTWEGECVHVQNSSPCDDGNPCTTEDSCSEAVCAGELLPIGELADMECTCVVDADCMQVEDGDVCNGTLHCVETDIDGVSKQVCLVDELTVPDCDDQVDCSVDDCHPILGCQWTPDDGACDDAEACTQDVCVLEDGLGCTSTALVDGSPCGGGWECLGGACACFPDCAEKDCGDDGCGGDCGACSGQDQCVDGACVCQPVCGDKDCGGDGCGGSCGSCGGYAVCADGQCVTLTTWTDPSTGLTWQNPHTASSWAWTNADWYCGALVLGGHSDWRLPTIWELRSVIDGCPGTMNCALCEVCEGCVSSTCKGEECDGCEEGAGPDAGCYWKAPLMGTCLGSWSSTAEPSGAGHWYVSFSSGAVDHGSDDSGSGIRCVR